MCDMEKDIQGGERAGYFVGCSCHATHTITTAAFSHRGKGKECDRSKTLAAVIKGRDSKQHKFRNSKMLQSRL